MFSLLPRRRPLLLVVCTANVCRSPAAAVALRASLEAQGARGLFRVASAGTHVGAPGRKPDPRIAALCRASGFSLRGERAVQLTSTLVRRAALIICMEQRHVESVSEMIGADFELTIRRLGEWSPEAEAGQVDIADPYYANAAAIERVFERITLSCARLADTLLSDASLTS